MTEDSLNWLAMQYVLDELSESERDLFEERMSNDLAACEAVAQASRLRLGLEQALVDLGTPTLLQRTPAERARHSRFAVAAAGLMLVGIFYFALFGPDLAPHKDFAHVQIPEHTNSSERLSDNVTLISLWRSGMTNADPESDELDDDPQELSDDDSVPAWLLAGVSLEMNESR